MKQRLTACLPWVTALLVPVALLMIATRLLLSPVFVEIEYRMPGFPDDSYGFTRAERLKWSKIAIAYLVNDADPGFLGDLKFPDGSALYNERELSHMVDVKVVTQKLLNFSYLNTALLILLGLWAWFGNLKQAYLLGLKRGGWLTIGLMGTILLFSLVSFWQFFVFFHSLFFEGDSWIFLYSDTLIRLFPIRFWQDVFIFAGVLVLGGALGLALGLKPRK